jgi:YD repeat-containing protein
MDSKSVLRLLLLCFSVLGVAWGQDAGNPPNLQTVPSDDFGVDSIDLQSLSIGISAPVISKPGAIPFSFSLQGSSYCGVIPFAPNGHAVECGIGPTKDYGTVSNVPFQNWLPMGVNGVVAEWGASWQLGYNIDTIVTCGTSTTHKHTDLFISGPDYTTYPLPAADYIEIGGCTHDIDDYTVLGGIHVVTTGGIPAITFPNGNVRGLASVTDPFGNAVSYSSGTTSYTDTLGTTIDITPSGRTTGTPGTYYWTDTTGTQQHMSEVVTAATLKTTFGCGTTAADQTYTGEVLSEIDYPDGHNLLFSYEPVSGGVTGRISQITLRTGGTVSYAYGAPLICNSNGLIPSAVSRVTSDGTTTYTVATFTGASGKFGTTTTILDPGKNKRVLTFMGTDQWGNGQFSVPLLVTQVQTWQNTGTVATPAYTLLSTTIYCYNGNATACPTTQAAYPITQKDTYVAPGTKTTYSRVKQTFDTYGNVLTSARYNFVAIGTGTPVETTNIIYGSWNGSVCVAVGGGIVNKPCSVVVRDAASNALSQVLYTYTSAGFMTTEQHFSGTQWIVTNYTANPNGTVRTSTNPTGAVTTYTYAATGSGGCNAILPTGTSTPTVGVTLTTAATWDCNGGKLLTSTDVNGNASQFTYDLLFRPASQTDPTTYAVNESYPTNTTATISDPFVSTTTRVDGLGRPIRMQTTDGASYDTVSSAYAFSGTQFQTSVSQPCIAALNADCTKNHFGVSDPLGRNISSSTTSNETVATAYNQNDVASTLTPIPTGEHSKVVQTEVDGLGRVTSTCAIQATGGTACGQVDGNSGILTTYSYSSAAWSRTVTATRGSQVHTTVYDALGRTKSVTIPESGTTTYVYDATTSTCNSNSSPNGQLVQMTDNTGKVTCYLNDQLGRIYTTYSPVSGVWQNCRNFIYGEFLSVSSHNTQPPGSGVNSTGRIVDATVDFNCNGTFSPDEWFSYDNDGRATDVWETTAHSGGQYHTTAGYYLNGRLHTLSGVPGKSTYTVTLDTEGRPDSSTLGATAIVTNVNYNGANQVTSFAYGASGGNDAFLFDANTGRMTKYTYTVGAATDVGTLTWNTNGTLKTLAIVDGLNAGGTQTCNFTYDDVARILTDNCGAVWNQSYAYDQYSNFSKSGSTIWNPGYNSTITCPTGTICNHITGANYDGAGRVTYDLNNSYSWDGYGKMLSANAGASVGSCGSAGVTCVTYDAFGRPAEKNVAGTFTEFLYSPLGLTATMSGQTTTFFRLPLPGGASLNGNSANPNTINHYDWLGSARLVTNLGSGSPLLDTAYTPYGEKYATFGSNPQNFTGDYQDLYAGLFDTPNREFDVASGSRWLSPDPAMASWNAYAYPTNPNSFIDPSGLRGCNPRRCTSNNEVGVGDNGGYDYQFSWGTAYGNSGLLSTAVGAVGSTSSSSLFQGTFSPAGTSANVDVTGVSSTIIDTGEQRGTTIRLYNNTSNANFYTGMSTGNGLRPIMTVNPQHPTGAGRKVHPKKKGLRRIIPMIQGFNLFTFRDFTEFPETWDVTVGEECITSTCLVGSNEGVIETDVLVEGEAGFATTEAASGLAATTGAALVAVPVAVAIENSWLSQYNTNMGEQLNQFMNNVFGDH